MKSLGILSFAVLANAAALPESLQKRQFDLTSFLLGRPLVPVLRRELKPEINQSAKRELLVWGPFKLIAANGTHVKPSLFRNKFDKNSDTIFNQVSGTCQDCMVLKASQLTSDKDGKWEGVEQGVYTHHFVSISTGKRQIMNPVFPKCGRSNNATAPAPAPAPMQHAHGQTVDLSTAAEPGMSVFIGKGNDEAPSVFASRDPKVKSGYYLPKDGRMVLSAELNNYLPKDRDIYISMDYEYIQSPVSGSKPLGYLDVGFGSMGVSCNLVGTFSPPKDKAITYTSPDWVVNTNGYFVNWVPHLHDGGIDIKVFVNGKEICTNKAIYGGEHGGVKAVAAAEKWETITAYDTCSAAIKVKKNDVVTLSSTYDVTKHKLRPDAAAHAMGMGGGMGAEGMALANFFFAPAEDQTANF